MSALIDNQAMHAEIIYDGFRTWLGDAPHHMQSPEQTATTLAKIAKMFEIVVTMYPTLEAAGVDRPSPDTLIECYPVLKQALGAPKAPPAVSALVAPPALLASTTTAFDAKAFQTAASRASAQLRERVPVAAPRGNRAANPARAALYSSAPSRQNEMTVMMKPFIFTPSVAETSTNYFISEQGAPQARIVHDTALDRDVLVASTKFNCTDWLAEEVQDRADEFRGHTSLITAIEAFIKRPYMKADQKWAAKPGVFAFDSGYRGVLPSSVPTRDEFPEWLYNFSELLYASMNFEHDDMGNAPPVFLVQPCLFTRTPAAGSLAEFVTNGTNVIFHHSDVQVDQEMVNNAPVIYALPGRSNDMSSMTFAVSMEMLTAVTGSVVPAAKAIASWSNHVAKAGPQQMAPYVKLLEPFMKMKGWETAMLGTDHGPGLIETERARSLGEFLYPQKSKTTPPVQRPFTRTQAAPVRGAPLAQRRTVTCAPANAPVSAAEQLRAQFEAVCASTPANVKAPYPGEMMTYGAPGRQSNPTQARVSAPGPLNPIAATLLTPQTYTRR